MWCTVYSTDQTQPYTRADPKSGPRVRFEFARGPLWVLFSKICVRFGSARGSLGVSSESAWGPLCVRSWRLKWIEQFQNSEYNFERWKRLRVSTRFRCLCTTVLKGRIFFNNVKLFILVVFKESCSCIKAYRCFHHFSSFPPQSPPPFPQKRICYRTNYLSLPNSVVMWMLWKMLCIECKKLGVSDTARCYNCNSSKACSLQHSQLLDVHVHTGIIVNC